MTLHDIRFPGETGAYRSARDALLAAEIDLEERLRAVADMRRALPAGGPVKEDYVFRTIDDGGEADIALSKLLAPDKPTLLIYSFMLGGRQTRPCPACTSLIDGLNGIAAHLLDRMNVAVCARTPISDFAAFAEGRGWDGGLTLLSSAANDYNADYHAETPDGSQIPALNVFHRDESGTLRHFYNAEKLYVQGPGHPRHVDRIWPIWNVMDLTPEGRDDWFPKVAYQASGSRPRTPSRGAASPTAGDAARPGDAMP